MARGKKLDLVGKRFGRLVVVSLNEEVSKQKKKTHWNCKCDCGNEVIVRGSNLSGGTTSCGCLKNEKSSKRLKEKWQDEEFRQMKIEKIKECWEDEEFRRMKSNKMKEKWQDEEFRQMKIEKTKEQWKDEEYRQMKSENSRETMKKMWQDEEYRQMKINGMSGEKHHNWKGGITPIREHLRSLPIVSQWHDDSKQQVNYTCELTGKVGGNLHTHHLKAFSTIVLEAHELHNIQIHEIVGDYTQEELHRLEEYVANWHKDNSNAVVLSEEVHKLFHKLYGKGDNTPEQFEEFRERYIAGEFKDLI